MVHSCVLVKISAKASQSLDLENRRDCLVALIPDRQLIQSSLPSSSFNPVFRPNSDTLVRLKSLNTYKVFVV